MYRFILYIHLLLISTLGITAGAAEEEPPLFDPRQAPADDAIEPSVVITEDDAITIKEYRVKGELYMIEIQPKKGKPYYLVDSDGDGSLDRRFSEMEPNFLIPSWIILKW